MYTLALTGCHTADINMTTVNWFAASVSPACTEQQDYTPTHSGLQLIAEHSGDNKMDFGIYLTGIYSDNAFYP